MGGSGGSVSGGTGGIAFTGGTGGTGGLVFTGGTGGAAQFCANFTVDEVFTVDLPPEGVPATPGQICSATLEPVESNRAARLTLTQFVNGGQSAKGHIAIEPQLLQRIVGTPKVQVLDASHPELLSLNVSAAVPTSDGYDLLVTWPTPLSFEPGFEGNQGFARFTAMIELELACDPAPLTRVVHAAHDLHLCLDDQHQDVQWVSSGDQCVVCRIIAEMAPSPIVPDASADALPLAQVLRLRVLELMRVGSSVVLFAENDGGEGVEYEWHASVGSVERLAPDVVLWTLEQGMAAPMMQVAAMSDNGAAVATFSWNDAV